MKNISKILVAITMLLTATVIYADVSNSFTWTMNQELIRVGSHGEQVEQLQQCLTDLGNNPGSNIDGFFGPITKAAVIEFQTEYNLQIDGIIGNETGPKYQDVCENAGEEIVPPIRFAMEDIVCCATSNTSTKYAYTSKEFSRTCESFVNETYSFEREVLDDSSCLSEGGNSVCGDTTSIQALKLIVADSGRVPYSDGMKCIDDSWKVSIEAGDECSDIATIDQEKNISYFESVCPEA